MKRAILFVILLIISGIVVTGCELVRKSELYEQGYVEGGGAKTVDLSINLLRATQSNLSNASGLANVTLTALVVNNGSARSGTSYTRFVVTPSGGTRNVYTPNILNGTGVGVITSYLLPIGNYTATAYADVYNTIREINENNNIRTINFVVALNYTQPPGNISNYCNDTDGGMNYGVFGTVSGYNGGIFYTFSDGCYTNTTNSTLLKEWYCSANYPFYTSFNCGSGNNSNWTRCSNGRCI